VSILISKEVARMFGLGKKRTPIGKWIDRNQWSQEKLREKSRVSRDTISRMCNDKNYIPGPTVKKKILDTIRKVEPNIKSSDFWDM
jgi:transcriptional regulator with XRE-family HTH domain